MIYTRARANEIKNTGSDKLQFDPDLLGSRTTEITESIIAPSHLHRRNYRQCGAFGAEYAFTQAQWNKSRH